jgi:SAM-dependent methyltransferase
MRAEFERALSAEPDELRERLGVLAGGIGDLAALAGEALFDAVLLHGVLMYLPSSTPVVAELAAHVAPGGLLSVATRTTTSALWRPAARQDWKAAAAAFAEYDAARRDGRDMAYVNEIGTPARADYFDALVSEAARHGLQLENWYGIRIAVDVEELDPPPPEDPAELAALIAVEERLGSSDPYRQLGQLAHLILRRPLR